jgi:hypothetical protein
MFKIHRILPAILAIVFAGCTADVPFTWTEPETPNIDDTTFVLDFDTTIHPYDGTTATDAANDIAGSDKDFYWEANKYSAKVNVTFSGTGAKVESTLSGIVSSVDGAYVAIDMATNGVKNVEVIVQGQTDDGSLKIYSNNKFKLTLNGVSIVSRRGPAINDQCKKRVFVHLADGTVNSLTDQADYVAEHYYAAGATMDTEDAKGCFFSEGNVIVSGTGSLVITAKHRHGLATDGYLWVRPGVTIAVTDAAKNALHAKGDADENLGIVINGGYIYANVSADGGKCLKSDNNIVVSGGTLSLNNSGDSYFDTDENDTSPSTCIKSGLSTAVHGGAIVMKSIGDSGKCVNAGKNLYVTGGNLCSYSLGRSLSADEGISQSGGKVYAFSRDNYAIYSPEVNISGGYIECITADSGQHASKYSATISGGYVAAYGSSPLTSPASSSTQPYVRHDGVSVKSGKALAVVSDGKCLIGLQADFSEPKPLPVLFSSPDMVRGNQYTLAIGATIADTSAAWQGLLTGGTVTNPESSVAVTAQ